MDENSNLSHQDGKIYRGDKAASMMRDIPNVVTGSASLHYNITGMEFLKPNLPGAVWG